ncbi:cell division cycle protein 16 homolog [Macrosteles quadrilineatus]|uniref:cell division cycle protein 16 homolog n=1 Tax=Macrosteles quadrilineatus TaxID=74068 RepID=UPI0023E33998|nr:cell division cycle protein 16 homolog [Macrosteles quadrilineatus]
MGDVLIDDLVKQEDRVATINRLRRLVKFYLDSNHTESAMFWADKAASISDSPCDYYWLAQCMFRSGEYQRAAYLIKSKHLDQDQPLFQWLAGLCLLEAKKYDEALLVLSGDCENISAINSSNSASSAFILNIPAITTNHILEGFTPETLRSALLTLKGRIYEKLDRKPCALECYKQALKCDVFCYEAFQAITKHQMLSASEEKELMDSLQFKSQCSNPGLLPFVYEQLLKKYQKLTPSELQLCSFNHNLGLLGNLDLKAARAERLLYDCAFKQSYALTVDILKADTFHKLGLQVHIACLVQLKKHSALFYLAHQLVDTYPSRAVTWYAVGCYYLVIGKLITARTYLGKAVYIDKCFGPAWLAYGHSLAKENEHDQAMAAYLSATKVMRGCHLPLMYVGTSCGLINNLKLAERFLTQAHSIMPSDPFVIHELGTIAYQNADFKVAEQYFLKALEEVRKRDKHIICDKWEPLLNNLGHTYRKLKNYDEALGYHHHALSILPKNPSTLTSIGFVQALQGKFVEAIESFHKVLTWKKDDSFSLTMLPYLIQQYEFVTPSK